MCIYINIYITGGGKGLNSKSNALSEVSGVGEFLEIGGSLFGRGPYI